MFFLLVVLGVVSVIGYVAWWVFLIWIGKKVFNAAMGNLDSLLPQIQAQIQAFHNLAPQQRAEQSQQITAMLLKMNRGLRDIDNLHRAQYEAKIGEIAGMAAQEGISFTPPSW